jgi:NADPH:quinone reductase
MADKDSLQMKSILLSNYSKDLNEIRVGTRPIPSVGTHEVLVKIAAAPINPSDLMFIQGQYGFKKAIPVIPGFEGCGQVVASGRGFVSRFLLGKRVACVAPEKGDGTWAEYMKTSAFSCLPIPDSISDEQGSMMFVNPFTAWALIQKLKAHRAKAFVQTAAGSQLGKMIWRLAEEFGLKSISIVRRKNQALELESLGMKNVLCSSDDDFVPRLKDLSKRLRVSFGLDAVAGDMTSILMSALPRGSRVIVYGGLSMDNPKVDVSSLIFQNKSLEGFWLSDWFKQQSKLELLKTLTQVKKRIGNELKTEIRATYPLDQAVEAIKTYSQSMSGGKILIRF